VRSFENAIIDILGRGLAVRFRAKGDSMYPSIRCGEHVQVAPASAGSLRIGDIVLARARRGLTAHRVVRLANDTITTRGDNALARDTALHHQSILGRVMFVERDGSQMAVPSAPMRFRVLARRMLRLVASLAQPVRSHA
jgi:signal peptidase I